MVVLFAALAAAILAIGLALLLPSFIAVRLAERELILSLEVEERASVRQAARDTMRKARNARETIAEFRSYAVSPVRASIILEHFFAPGEGIRVDSLLIRRDGTASLSGYADTRTQLLHFEETLRNSNRFLAIEFPLSNIVRDLNIQFSMQGKLKPEHGL